jgi:hypothetical protein
MTDKLLPPSVEPQPIGPFFRFPDKATGMACLRAAGLIYLDEDDTEHFFTASHTHALDVVGTITRGGEWDPETGDVITPPTVLDGWHINYQGDLPDGWEQYAVAPQSPTRVFF